MQPADVQDDKRDTCAPVHITVAICTHDRAEYLAGCIEALKPQMSSACEYIVVDSGSSPGQRELIARTVASAPGFQLIRLDKPGLSLARNAALGCARGEWLATLDDDAVPAANWADTALALTERVSPEFTIIAGAVHPIFPAGLNPQIGPRWRQLISAVEMEGEYDQTERPQVVAANLFFRRRALLDIGGFPENLGRVGKSLLSGEDKLCVHRLLKRGSRIWYSGNLSVGHHIGPERLAPKWPRRRAYWDGRSDRRIEHMLGEKAGAARTLGIFAKLIGLAPLYFIADKREFSLRFWYNVGWLQETLVLLFAAA